MIVDNILLCYNKPNEKPSPKPKMLYEPPKTKRNILIFGAVAVTLAVLVIVAAPLIYKQKTFQAPTANLPLTAKDRKIQKDAKEFSQKMKADPQSEQAMVEQKIKEDVVKISEEVKSAPEPSKEEIQKALEQLNK